MYVDFYLCINFRFILSSPAMYYDLPEITPHNLKGDFRYNKAGERVTRYASHEAEVRALIEGQFMAKRLHAERMGLTIGKWKPEADSDTDKSFPFFPDESTRILVTGGASVNKAILQVVADIFNAPVYVQVSK